MFKSRTPRVVKRNTKTHPMAPSPIVGEEFVCYEVEKVLDSKIGDIGRIYYVQWKGYSSVYNSWIEDLPPYFKKYKAMYEDSEYDEDEDEESDFSPEYGTDEDEDSSEDSDSSLESDLDDDEVVASEKKAVKKAVKKPIAKNLKTNNKRLTPKDEKSSKKYRFISKTLAALAEMVGDEDSD
jgi:hypothetical protein